jgi:hypothetical protein
LAVPPPVFSLAPCAAFILSFFCMALLIPHFALHDACTGIHWPWRAFGSPLEKWACRKKKWRWNQTETRIWARKQNIWNIGAGFKLFEGRCSGQIMHVLHKKGDEQTFSSSSSQWRTSIWITHQPVDYHVIKDYYRKA